MSEFRSIAAMSPDSIRQLVRATPFEPIEIHLADGRTLEVPHPDFIALTRSGRSVIVTDPHQDENWEIVDVFLILSAGPKKKRPKTRKV
jgi:hypothetical protein